MRQLIIVAISIAAFVVPALGQQETPSVEVFGGYQFSHFTPSINANGWNTAVTGNVNRWFGITGDVSGSYKNGGHMYTYMVGPTLSARTERVTPFVHALFGGASAGGGEGSANAFAMAFGGGLDVNAGNHLAWRMVQADWLLFRSGGETDKKNVRVSSGLVFRF